MVWRSLGFVDLCVFQEEEMIPNRIDCDLKTLSKTVSVEQEVLGLVVVVEEMVYKKTGS